MRGLILASAIAISLVAGACGGSEDSDLQAYQAEDSIAMVAQLIEGAKTTVEAGQVHENLVDSFPETTAESVRSDLDDLDTESKKLTDISPDIRSNIENSINDTRLALNGLTTISPAIEIFEKANRFQTEKSLRTAYAAFDEVLAIPDGVDQYLSDSMDEAVEAIDEAQVALEDLERLDSSTNAKIDEIRSQAEEIKLLADDLGDDRERLIQAAMRSLRSRADEHSGQCTSDNPVFPSGAQVGYIYLNALDAECSLASEVAAEYVRAWSPDCADLERGCEISTYEGTLPCAVGPTVRGYQGRAVGCFAARTGVTFILSYPGE